MYDSWGCSMPDSQHYDYMVGIAATGTVAFCAAGPFVCVLAGKDPAATNKQGPALQGATYLV